MAAYDKSLPNLHGFDNSRSFAEPSYSYAAPSYVSQPASSSNPAAYYTTPQATSVVYGGRVTQYNEQQGTYLNVGPTAIPEVLSYQPQTGWEGTRFEVNISILYEISSVTPVSIMFNTRKCPATLTRAQPQSTVFQYVVAADVPPFHTAEWESSTLPVCLLIENGEGGVIGKVDVGNFTYDSSYSNANAIKRVKHERGGSGGSAHVKNESRNIGLPIDTRPKVEYHQHGFSQSSNVTEDSWVQAASSNPPAQTPLSSRQSPYQYESNRRSTWDYPQPSTSASANAKSSAHISSWAPYPSASVRGTASGRVGKSSDQKLSLSSRQSFSNISGSASAHPKLVRTSTIQAMQQMPSPALTPLSGQTASSYHYAPYAPKATLKIVGNLDSMTQGWTYDEWETKRRLVLFERSQNGSEIITTFKSVTPEERPNNSICISCIYWPQMQDMFVTSVDTIALLEKLVMAQFQVEEKNRIRRNLEGFRPLTISKGKADTEEMFKIIMLFPNPKPRNIEKDVKVFPWKILSSALKKIISKYSASPASIIPAAPAPAPALLTPASSVSYSTESHSRGRGSGEIDQSLASPRSLSGVSASYPASARTISPTISTISSHRHNQGLQVHGPPDLRLSVPAFSSHTQLVHQSQGPAEEQTDASQLPSLSHNPWSVAHSQLSVTGYGSSSLPSNLGDRNSRTSWDLNTYLQTSPSTITPTSAVGQSHTHSQMGQGSNRHSYEHNSASHSGAIDNSPRVTLSGQMQSQQMPSRQS